ncbi:MAG: hypothetical protein ACE5SW_11985 [Nitrososphaeraceae archaeon]
MNPLTGRFFDAEKVLIENNLVNNRRVDDDCTTSNGKSSSICYRDDC